MSRKISLGFEDCRKEDDVIYVTFSHVSEDKGGEVVYFGERRDYRFKGVIAVDAVSERDFVYRTFPKTGEDAWDIGDAIIRKGRQGNNYVCTIKDAASNLLSFYMDYKKFLDYLIEDNKGEADWSRLVTEGAPTYSAFHKMRKIAGSATR